MRSPLENVVRSECRAHECTHVIFLHRAGNIDARPPLGRELHGMPLALIDLILSTPNDCRVELMTNLSLHNFIVFYIGNVFLQKLFKMLHERIEIRSGSVISPVERLYGRPMLCNTWQSLGRNRHGAVASPIRSSPSPDG